MNSEFTVVQALLDGDILINGMPLIFKGEINHEVKKVFTKMAEEIILQSNQNDTVRRKVFRVLVECIENITKHSDEVADPLNPIGQGLFMVGERDDHYYILTGNLITKEKVPKIKHQIGNINNANKDELRNMHKEQILNGKLSEKGGAGLGLIEIARKSGSKIEYHVIPRNEIFDFILMKIKIFFH